METADERPLAIKKDGQLAGYLLTGKDGKTIYELVTERQEDLEAAVKAYLAYAGVQETEIYVPAFDKNLNQCIGRFAEYYSTEPSGMYQIFDFANVLEAYLTLKQNTLGLTPGEFSAYLDGQPVTVRVTDAGVCVERKALPGAVVLENSRPSSSCFPIMAVTWRFLLRQAGSRCRYSGIRQIPFDRFPASGNRECRQAFLPAAGSRL